MCHNSCKKKTRKVKSTNSPVPAAILQVVKDPLDKEPSEVEDYCGCQGVDQLRVDGTTLVHLVVKRMRIPIISSTW